MTGDRLRLPHARAAWGAKLVCLCELGSVWSEFFRARHAWSSVRHRRPGESGWGVPTPDVNSLLFWLHRLTKQLTQNRKGECRVQKNYRKPHLSCGSVETPGRDPFGRSGHWDRTGSVVLGFLALLVRAIFLRTDRPPGSVFRRLKIPVFPFLNKELPERSRPRPAAACLLAAEQVCSRSILA